MSIKLLFSWPEASSAAQHVDACANARAADDFIVAAQCREQWLHF